jgi:hypothetical protein
MSLTDALRLVRPDRLSRGILALGGVSLVVFTALGIPAHADRLVVLKKADASPELMEMARRLFRHDFERMKDCRILYSNESDPTCPEGQRRPSIDKDVAKGEADLNDDGVAERFFVLEVGISTCGTAGCMFKILQKQGDDWRVILDDSAGPITVREGGSDQYIRILDQADLGYHRLCSGYLEVWNGTQYGPVFASKKDEDEDEGIQCDARLGRVHNRH